MDVWEHDLCLVGVFKDLYLPTALGYVVSPRLDVVHEVVYAKEDEVHEFDVHY